jgi:hypothetical protein
MPVTAVLERARKSLPKLYKVLKVASLQVVSFGAPAAQF